MICPFPVLLHFQIPLVFTSWKSFRKTGHCGMFFPLSDDKHWFVWDNSKRRTGNPRQIQSKTKFSLRKYPRIFFSNKFFSNNFFFWLNFVSDWILIRTAFVSDWILSQTEFVSDWICLGLNFVSDWIYLRLNFISDWICLRLILSRITYRSCISYAII